MTLCLVTGGASFIGSHTVDELLRRDASVRVLDNFSTGKRENLREALPHIDLVVRGHRRSGSGETGY